MNAEQLKQAIQNYSWTIREIDRLYNSLRYTEFKGVASADTTIKSSAISNPIVGEIIRREAKSKRLIRMEQDVLFIQGNLHKVTDEKQKTILECMLDGMTPMEVVRHMGIGRTTVWRHLDKAIEVMINE
jgi:DNA-directed RNA polymerase specialized sigma subunit